MCVVYFAYPFIDQLTLGFLPSFLAVVDKATVDNGVQESIQVPAFIYPGYTYLAVKRLCHMVILLTFLRNR